MAPLVVLLVVTPIAWFVTRDALRSGRLALAVMFVVTGIAHFVSYGSMVAMMPPVVPLPGAVVIVTGLVEVAFAGLLVLRPGHRLGWAILLFLLAVLPANVWSALSESGLGGHGASYLWFRIPLQALFIGWALVVTGALRLPIRSRRVISA